MRKRVVWSAVVALCMGGQALAEGMSYNYLQGGLYASQAKKDGESDGSVGYKFEGAISNNMPFFVFFNLAANKYPDASNNLRLTHVSAGLGGHMPLTDTLDAVGAVSYENLDIKAIPATDPPAGTDAFPPRGGLGFAAGLRGKFGERTEWTAGIKYRDLKSNDSALSLSVGGRYFLTPRLALGVELTGVKYDLNYTFRLRPPASQDPQLAADLTDLKEYSVLVGLRYQFNDPW